MKTKFFLEGHYRVRLDHIQPKEAKPHNRIHLKFAMLLTEEEMKQAPTNIRKTFALINDQELEMPKATIATKLKGIDIEIYATPPVSKKIPLLATLSNCTLRDILIHRLTKGEIRMFFSVGIAFDRGVWKWGGNQVFMDCFAKFSQSQSEMFDEDAADESLHDEETGSDRSDEIDELAADLNDGKSAAAGDPVRVPDDPLLSPAHGVQQMAIARRKKRRGSEPFLKGRNVCVQTTDSQQTPRRVYERKRTINRQQRRRTGRRGAQILGAGRTLRPSANRRFSRRIARARARLAEWNRLYREHLEEMED